jgi:iron complex outermembrane receptor protein
MEGKRYLTFIPKELHFENSISVVYGDNKGVSGKPLNPDAKYLPFIPPTHGISELRFDVSSKSGHFINGFIKAQLEYYAAQNHAYLGIWHRNSNTWLCFI